MRFYLMSVHHPGLYFIKFFRKLKLKFIISQLL